MRTVLPCLAFFTLAVLVPAADDAPAKKDSPSAKKGAPAVKKDSPPDLPGPFHPFDVTGPNRNRYHCPISEHGLDPIVLVFHKDLELSEPLRGLAQKLDAAIEKNPNARLASCIVFLPDPATLPEIVGDSDKNDDARLKVSEKVEDWGKALKLKHVVLALDSKADLEKYNLRDTDLVTVVLCNKLKVLGTFALPKSDFTEASVAKIIKAVADQLGATRQ
jgi:hypothetical protein